jgi:hypothetical protein
MLYRIAVLCFYAVAGAPGAIVLHPVSSQTAPVGASTIPVQFIVSTNVNRFLGVGCAWYTTSGNPNQEISSVDWNGKTLTRLRRDKNPNYAVATEYWYMLAPASGKGKVTVRFSAPLPNGGGGCVAKEFSGVSQSQPIDTSTFSFTSGTVSQNAGTIQVGIAGAMVDNVLAASRFAGLGPNQVGDVSRAAGPGVFVASGHSDPVFAPGSVNPVWTFASSSGATMMTLVSIRPDTASP